MMSRQFESCVLTVVNEVSRLVKMQPSVLTYRPVSYRVADKSLARPGRKKANVSVRTA